MRFRHDIASQVVFFSLLSSLTHILGGFQLLYHLVFTVLPCISLTWAAVPFYLVGLARQFDYVFYGRAVWCCISRFFTKKRTGEQGVFYFESKVYPYDIDWMKHMNNTKYLCVAKLARLSAMLQAGIWTTPYRITSYSTSYCKEIRLSQSFLVKTLIEDFNTMSIIQTFCDEKEDKVFFKLRSEASTTNTSIVNLKHLYFPVGSSKEN